MSSIQVIRLREVDEVVVPQINRLLRQLHSESIQHNVLSAADHLARSITVVAVRKHDNVIVGMAVVVPRHCWTHVDGVVGNIVVDREHRNDAAEIVSALLKRAVSEASGLQFAYLWCTVSPEQYPLDYGTMMRGLGFEERERTFFKHSLGDSCKTVT